MDDSFILLEDAEVDHRSVVEDFVERSDNNFLKLMSTKLKRWPLTSGESPTQPSHLSLMAHLLRGLNVTSTWEQWLTRTLITTSTQQQFAKRACRDFAQTDGFILLLKQNTSRQLYVSTFFPEFCFM